MQDHIDFIKGQPVLHQSFVASEDRPTKVFVKGNHLTVAPTAIFFDQMDRTVKMRDRHQRFDLVFAAF